MNFGIPYMGSKSKIAPQILQILPRGKRFVDLFGGGMAMTHCALLRGKWDSYLYNDYNPLLVPFLKKAIAGEYSYDKFKPKFINRKEFIEFKDKDGYIKYIYSFGNCGRAYLFGKDVEPLKENAHNLVVFGKWNDDLLYLLGDSLEEINNIPLSEIKARRLFFCSLAKKNKKRIDLQQLERLGRLQQLERLERLPKLELKTGSYFDYEFKNGDIVYCDPPYEGTAEYSEDGFNHKEFYNWVFSRPYEVFFSSYEISDKRFYKICQFEKASLFNSGSRHKKVETIYSNFNNKQELF